MTEDSLGWFDLAGRRFRGHRLTAVPGAERLPVSLKILLENLLRHRDGGLVTDDRIAALLDRRVGDAVPFFPSRVFLHDTNGVPVLTDLAALRDAVAAAGHDPTRVRPRVPAHLTVDHSIAAEFAGTPDALRRNIDLEYRRNAERFGFLRWGESLDGLRVIPPGAGIMHQINLEVLAQVVEFRDGWAYPDTCAGTDSHTTMVNALGVLAWGVGGIEAEVALLGQPLDVVIPPVVGVELVGELAPTVTATDLVLTVVETLRAHGVVGKFVEFTGPAVAGLPLAHRATVANMCPEFGATVAMFAVDDATLDYLRLTGRGAEHVAAVEAYAKEQGLWHDPERELDYDERLRIDLGEITASLAGPRRPQDRVPLRGVRENATAAVTALGGGAAHAGGVVAGGVVAGGVVAGGVVAGGAVADPAVADRAVADETVTDGAAADRAAADRAITDRAVADPAIADPAIADGAVAIAAITSCTNTSNPHAMVAAGLLARNARARGLRSRPWVKTSLSPGSRAVTEYLTRAGLSEPLDELGFQVVGYGCMTCIGNSGPLLPDTAAAVADGAIVAAVLSGNRNFDGRINNDVSLNYLASPPLVVAYALAGSVLRDLTVEPLGTDPAGDPVYLADVWPSDAEVDDVVTWYVTPAAYAASSVDDGGRWAAVPSPGGDLFEWPAGSTYLRRPPFLDDVPPTAPPVGDLRDAKVLLLLGDSVTTDHISPAGRIPPASPAGRYLTERGETDLNTYASRRGNFEVMVRGGFANPRLHNRIATDTPVYEVARAHAGTPLLVIAGKEYGTGSSRDWAAKATALLGVKVVLAESFERIHRSNLVQLGVLPLQFADGQTAESLGITGTETFDVLGVPGPEITVRVRPADGPAFEFPVMSRLDTQREIDYYTEGGVLPFVFRRFLRGDQ